MIAKLIRDVILCIFACLFLISCSIKTPSESQPLKDIDSAFGTLPPNDDIYQCIPKERVEANVHMQQIDIFDSEISVGYKHKDGTYTAYIFSSPIRYRQGTGDLEYIDNRLISINSGKYYDRGFLYRNNKNDIFSYFPSYINTQKGF